MPGVEEPRDRFHSTSSSCFPPALKGISAIYLIDAVDECEQSTALDFLRSLSELVRESKNSLAKVLLFSRHTMLSGIDGCFRPGAVHRIDMNLEDQQIQNVEQYIRSEVGRLCDVRTGLMEFREDIIRELDKRSSGIYLLARLTLKSLAKSKGSPSDIRKLLGGLPQNLVAIYSDALQKIKLEDRARVSAMLLWLVFAMRPLRESEISAVIEFCSSKRNFKSLRDLDDEVSRDVLGASGISELVGPLIKITADGFVTMVHSSAREYILSLTDNPDRGTGVSPEENAWVWESLITSSKGEGDLPALAAHALSSYCLGLAGFVDDEKFLLSVSQMGSDAASRSRGSQKPHNGVLSLIKYSIENLPDHIRQSSTFLISRIHPLFSEPGDQFAAFLQRKPKGDIWMRTFWVLRDPTQQYDHDLTPLQFCCALNLAPCVRKLLPRSGFPQRSGNWIGSEIPRNGMISQYLTAVDVASMFGNVEILAILCEEHHTPISLKFQGRISDPMISLPAFSTLALVTDPFSTRSEGSDAATEIMIAQSLQSENMDETRGNREFSRNRSMFCWLVSGRRARNTISAAVPDHANRELRSYQPLFTTTRYGQVAAIDYLVELGCDIFEENEDGDDDDTPDDITLTKRIALEVAIDGKNHAAASALYRHHTKDNATRRKTLERLMTSHSQVDERDLRRLAYLVGLFPELWDPSLEVETGDEPLKTSVLHIAATANNVEVFEVLTNLWRKANPALHHFPLDSQGRHPLHYAAAARRSRTIERIIQADPDTRMCADSQHRNSLYYAASGIKIPWCDEYVTETPPQDVARVLVGGIKSTEACDLLIRSGIISLTEVAGSKPTTATDNKMFESMEQKINALMSLATPGFRMGPDFPHKTVASFNFPLQLALEISTHHAYEFYDLEGRNLLHAAVAASRSWSGEPGFVELVDAFRGRINEEDAGGKTALRTVLEHAISEDKDEILFRVSLLLKAGSSIDCPEDTTTNSEPMIVTAANLIINRHSGTMSRTRIRQSTPGLIHAFLSEPQITATTVVERIPGELLIKLIVALVNSSAWSRNDLVDSERLNLDCSILLSSLSTRQKSYLHHYACNKKQTPAELVVFYYKYLSLQEIEQIVNNNLRYEEIENALFLAERKTNNDMALGELERLCKARVEKHKKRWG